MRDRARYGLAEMKNVMRLRWIDAGSSGTEHDRVVALHSIRLRATQSVHSWPLVLVGAPLCLLAILAAGADQWATLWAAAMVASATLNWHISKPLTEAPETLTSTQIHQAQVKLWWMTVLNTAVMGSGIWLVAAELSDTRLWIVFSALQVLYSFAALVNASTHPPTFVSGAIINMGSLFIFWVTRSAEGALIAVMMAALFLLMLKLSRQISADFDTTVRMRFENANLFRRLEIKTIEETRAREAAEAANIAKSRFLAAASHDLRQPLHTLMLFSGLLERGTSAQRAEFVEHIQAAARTLDHLFGELLDLSKLDAGAMSASISAVTISSLLESLLKEYEPVAREKGLTFEYRLPSAKVSTDPFLFMRLARNLIENAIRYTPRGGIQVNVGLDAETASIHIIDSGIGIAPEDQSRIFDEFYQVGNTSRASEHGSGLGLAIVSRIAKLLGHEIQVKSAIGRGTTMTVTLHRLHSAEPDMERDPALATASRFVASRPRAGLRILLVDDDRRVRAAMAAVFSSWDSETTAAGSFEETLRLCDDRQFMRPDLVFVDYRLPDGKTGFDVIRVLRGRFDSIATAIVTGDIETFPDDSNIDGIPIFRKPVSEAILARWAEFATRTGPPPQSVQPEGHRRPMAATAMLMNRPDVDS